MGLLSSLFKRGTDFVNTADAEDPTVSFGNVNEINDLLKAAREGSNEAFKKLDAISENAKAHQEYEKSRAADPSLYDDYYMQCCSRWDFPFYPTTEHEYGKYFDNLDDNLFVVYGDTVRLSNHPEILSDALTFYGSHHPSPLKAWYLTRHLTAKANAGDPVAMYALATARVLSDEVNFMMPTDDTKMSYREQIAKMTEQGNSWGQYMTGLLAGSRTIERFDNLLLAAQSGNANAAYDLVKEVRSAFFYLDVKEDYQKVFWLYEIGANGSEGDLLSYMQHSYGEYFYEGEVIPVDYDSAVYWNKRAIGSNTANGSSLAESTLDYLEKNANDIRARNGDGTLMEQPTIEQIRNLYRNGAVKDAFERFARG